MRIWLAALEVNLSPTVGLRLFGPSLFHGLRDQSVRFPFPKNLIRQNNANLPYLFTIQTPRIQCVPDRLPGASFEIGRLAGTEHFHVKLLSLPQ
jgi:hypothetical protein